MVPLDSVSVGAAFVAKVAVTLLFALIVTTQVLDPLQAPLQPLKLDPEAGVADSVTTVLLAKLWRSQHHS